MILETTTQLEKVRFIKVTELKLSQVELFSFYHCICVAAKASELFCRAHLANIEYFLYLSKLSFLNIEFHMHVNSLVSAEENQLKCEKVRFLSEMGEINPR